MESRDHHVRLVEVGIKNFGNLIDLAPFDEPENEVARKLYRSFGFVEMKMPEGWDEVPAVLKL